MILVADDNVAVRNLLHDSLTYYGYKVILAVDGQDAVEKFEEHKDRIRLVLMDVVMPNKNGIESCREIRQICPEMKVLLLSGYATDIIQKMGGLDDGVELVKKPFNPSGLVWKIRNMLDTGSIGGEELTV